MELGPPAVGPEVGGGAEAALRRAGRAATVEEGSGATDPVVTDAAGAGSDEAGAAGTAPASRLTLFGRYRNAALVGAGGLACAAVGAFMGGLGGYFTVAPAAAHAVGATAQDTPLADAINGRTALHGPGRPWVGRQRPGHPGRHRGLPDPGHRDVLRVQRRPECCQRRRRGGAGLGFGGRRQCRRLRGRGSGGSGAGCASGDAGLASLIDNVTCTLVGIGSLPGSGTAGLSSLERVGGVEVSDTLRV